MTITVKHKKVATAPDDPQYEINSTEWNDEHEIAGIDDALSAKANVLHSHPMYHAATDKYYVFTLDTDPDSGLPVPVLMEVEAPV